MAETEGLEARRARLEALRVRLYRPDASDEDHRRFAALSAELVERPDEEPVGAAPGGPGDGTPGETLTRPRRRARTTLIPAAVLVLAAVAALAVVGRAAAPTRPPPTAVVDTVSGQEVQAGLVTPQPDAPVPTSIPTSLAGVETAVQRFHGRGSTVVVVDTRLAQRRNGTLLVMLTTLSGRAVNWYATRPGHPMFAEIVAESDPYTDPSEPAGYGIHVYDGAPPTRLAVQAGGGVDWTLSIAFLPRKDLPY